ELALGSEPVKNWNHLNPQSLIDEKTLPREGSIQQFLKSRADESAALRKELLSPISGRIAKDEKLQPDEKNVHILLAEKILDSAPPLVWYVLLKFAGTEKSFRSLLGGLRNCIEGYIKKCAVAEYAALMIMELAANIENINIQKEARVYYKTPVLNMRKILQDPKFRMPLIAEMRKKNKLLTFSWKLGGASQSIGTRGKFQVTLFDSEANYKETRESMEATRSADAGRFNLSEYYKKLQNSGNELELGVYYLSYFNEACEKAGIKFESMVNQTQYSDQTITTLSFVL
ncbi:MAG: hypothetical protein LBN92_05480, partial [Treponema sp.]|nr:hypothetical protein [Treponema sp.]